DPDGERILRQDPLAFAALAKYPYAPGHVLVLPTRHVADIEDLSTDEHAAIASLMQMTVGVLREVSEPHGFNIGLNLGRIAAAGIRVTRYDARGYGASSRPTGDPYSHVRDLEELMNGLDITSAALVGCSMGGGNEIDFTLEHPDRVWALVPIAAGLGGFEAFEEEEDWWEAANAPVDEAIAAGDLERAEDARLAIWAPLGTDDTAGARIR